MESKESIKALDKDDNQNRQLTDDENARKSRLEGWFHQVEIPNNDRTFAMSYIDYLYEDWQMDITVANKVTSLFINHKADPLPWIVIYALAKLYGYVERHTEKDVYLSLAYYFEHESGICANDPSNKLLARDIDKVRKALRAGSMDEKLVSYRPTFKRELPDNLASIVVGVDNSAEYSDQDGDESLVESDGSSDVTSNASVADYGEDNPETHLQDISENNMTSASRERSMSDIKTEEEDLTEGNCGAESDADSSVIIDASLDGNSKVRLGPEITSSTPNTKKSNQEHNDRSFRSTLGLEAAFGAAKAQLEEERFKKLAEIERGRAALDLQALETDDWYGIELNNLEETQKKRRKLFASGNASLQD